LDTQATIALRTAIAAEAPVAELERLVADVSGALKLQPALPEQLVTDVLVRRLSDRAAVAATVDAPIDRTHG
jgi:hypothetical protein